jgi:nitrile hydratase accessory protein
VTAESRPRIDVEGSAAPPRRNGELVFQEPWEGRAFGLAVALGDGGLFPWEAFRRRLIGAIAEADRRREGEESSGYYTHWLVALQTLLVDTGILTAAEVEARMRQFATGERDIVDPGVPQPSGDHPRLS